MNIYTPKDLNYIPAGETSIFLAGPTLRNNPKAFTPWREEAIKMFSDKKFEGSIFIPEPFTGDYEKQILWEEKHLDLCSCILFWIPRDMKTLPGLTTNVEFGDWMKSSKAVLGFPKEAEHMSYLEHKAKKYKIPVLNTLQETVSATILRGVIYKNIRKVKEV